VACRTPRDKRDLVRVVRTPQGAVTIDPTGRLAGRGAYLCRDAACWDLAGRRRALEHALAVQLPDDVLAALAAGPAALAATTESPHRAIGATPDSIEGGSHGSK
jgi:predicted RNA-binding protein YlxR (DUF448 family)